VLPLGRFALIGSLGFWLVHAAGAQTTPYLRTEYLRAIRQESSGELALTHFRHIVGRYSGFSPSRGGDQIAEYLADQARAHGLSEVTVEGFPADGHRFFWTFLTEPAWEAESGTLTMIEPRADLLADFAIDRVVLGRFSSSADLTADLVDVGMGIADSDYQGKDLRGRLALASGEPGAVHAAAVWGHGAAGVVWYRGGDAREPLPLVGNPTILPWAGPRQEPPGLAFGIPYARAAELREMLRRGERVRLRAVVRAATGAGHYQQVSAVIPGTDRGLPEVWVNAHDNYRNTGGGNNLTGVGATVEIARVLTTLIARGVLPRPRRTIRFLWGAEHYSSVYNFFAHPERAAQVLTFLNVDMVGYHQERAKAVFHLYRLPHSLPHFSGDVAEEVVEAVGRANRVSVRQAPVSAPVVPGGYDPIFAPSGSRDQLHYTVEDFWGPSDHEDVIALGVPAVLYNDWPDPYIGTQADDIDKADPTQMRRAVLTIGATAYALASVLPGEVGRWASLIAGLAAGRMGREAGRALALLTDSLPNDLPARYRAAVNLLDQSASREHRTIQSLAALGDHPAAVTAIARARRHLAAVHAANLAALRSALAELGPASGRSGVAATPTELERRLAAATPIRVDSIRGPVHFFRPEYGLAWLRLKAGKEDVRSSIALAGAGHYVLFEALNFADGRRTLSEIRDAVTAEYGSVSGEAIEEYFRFLERVGVVTIVPAGRPR